MNMCNVCNVCNVCDTKSTSDMQRAIERLPNTKFKSKFFPDFYTEEYTNNSLDILTGISRCI